TGGARARRGGAGAPRRPDPGGRGCGRPRRGRRAAPPGRRRPWSRRRGRAPPAAPTPAPAGRGRRRSPGPAPPSARGRGPARRRDRRRAPPAAARARGRRRRKAARRARPGRAGAAGRAAARRRRGRRRGRSRSFLEELLLALGLHPGLEPGELVVAAGGRRIRPGGEQPGVERLRQLVPLQRGVHLGGDRLVVDLRLGPLHLVPDLAVEPERVAGAGARRGDLGGHGALLELEHLELGLDLLARAVELDRVAGRLVAVRLQLEELDLALLLLAQALPGQVVVPLLDRADRALLPGADLALERLDVPLHGLGGRLVRQEVLERLLALLFQLHDGDVDLLGGIDRPVDGGVRLRLHRPLHAPEESHSPSSLTSLTCRALEPVLLLPLPQLIIREAEHLGRFPLVVTRLLERFHADRALERLDPGAQRLARVVPRGGRIERLAGARRRRQGRLDVAGDQHLAARRVDRALDHVLQL